MTRSIIFASILTSMMVLPAKAESPTNPETVSFQYTHKPGETTTIRLTGKTFGFMKLVDPLPEMKFSQTYQQDMKLVCKQVNEDKSAVYEATLGRIAMKQAMGGINMDFDSTNPDVGNPNDPAKAFLSKIISALTSSKLLVTIGADGQPRSVEGLSEMMNKIMDEIEKESPSIINKTILEPMRKMFDDKMLSESMKQYYRMVPPIGTRKVGETWEQTWNMPMPFAKASLSGKGQYELLGVEEIQGHKCAKIRIKESFQTGDPSQATTKPAQPIQLSIKTAGGEGIACVDITTGMVIRLRQTQDLSMELGLAPDENSDIEMLRKGFGPMTMEHKTAVSIDLIDGETPATTKAAVTQ